MLAPATLAVINTSFTEGTQRARAFGAWSASGGVGGMAGAVAGGAITTGLSWRWVFLINVPIGAVLIVVAMMSLAGTRTGRRESLDLARRGHGDGGAGRADLRGHAERRSWLGVRAGRSARSWRACSCSSSSPWWRRVSPRSR